ncbi:helix-turn-helix domain-containing protein [Pedobacter mucosus]|uniref:helix-turn-helix domain-containing protein n=1 Tax=Pedobacter mucosus TaxID=2895286 RepID=UPI001EE4CD58|nr:HTH domain-containing protein [Pedobacter mucosus]UKT65753.1 helix-turn-helix domain containing protein [Pedobacter mucosus]
MILNNGQILERVIRRDRMGISELSRKLNVSRRTIYNWFDQKTLNPEIIWKVGNVIGHDFSIDLPDAFAKGGNVIQHSFTTQQTEEHKKISTNSVYFWMNKYIRLLEKYNEVLVKGTNELESSETIDTDTISKN